MENKEQNKFYCPMKCEGGKVYDHPGNCPVCNMHLVPIEEQSKGDHSHSPAKGNYHHVHDHEHQEAKAGGKSGGKYYCPMHCPGIFLFQVHPAYRAIPVAMMVLLPPGISPGLS